MACSGTALLYITVDDDGTLSKYVIEWDM
jgi:hypothetical protein